MKRKISILLLIISCLGLYIYFNGLIEDTNQIELEVDDTKIDVESYVLGVLACEMPALFEENALKAQAIASRTYALYKSNNDLKLLSTIDDQCYIDEEEMKIKWKDNYEEYHEKLKNIVLSTNNQVMKKDNKLFKSFYFSTSNGYTEDSYAVFQEGNIKSVDSPWDKNTKNYKMVKEYKKDELVSALGQFYRIYITKRNSTNHVEEVKIDERTLSGIEFRKKLNLRSTDFTIEVEDDIYYITTYGYGHGVGMSQYGANELAKLGYTYDEILKYYYGEIEIKKI